MTHSALASRYASALVDVATGPKSGVDPHELLRELRGFEEVLAGSAELRNALMSPAVPASCAVSRKCSPDRRSCVTLSCRLPCRPPASAPCWGASARNWASRAWQIGRE